MPMNLNLVNLLQTNDILFSAKGWIKSIHLKNLHIFFQVVKQLVKFSNRMCAALPHKRLNQ
jgi:hypothetical protein